MFKTFPFDENFSKIYYVGFNTHYFYHITRGEILEKLKIPEVKECIPESCKDKYQNSPTSLWLSLIFLLIPKKYHQEAFSVSYLISALVLLIFSIHFCFKREKLLLFIIIPYISSLFVRFMMTGGIIFHIISSILCIIGWEKLKEFSERRENKTLIYASLANTIACFMNITFIIPVLIIYMTNIDAIKRKIFIPVFFLAIISPFYIIYYYQTQICLPPEWHKIITQEILGSSVQKNFIYSIKLILNHSPIVPLVALISIIMITLRIGRKEGRGDIITCLILTLGIASSLFPWIISKGAFFPRFEMIPVFIMTNMIHTTFFRSKYTQIAVIIFGIISSIVAIRTKDNVFTFKNFPYEPMKNLVEKVREANQDTTILIETLENLIISEDTYLLSLETDKHINGLFYDASSILLKKDKVIYTCGKNVIREPIISALEKFKIHYVICKTKKCSKSLSQICRITGKYKIENLTISFEILKCEINQLEP